MLLLLLLARRGATTLHGLNHRFEARFIVTKETCLLVAVIAIDLVHLATEKDRLMAQCTAAAAIDVLAVGANGLKLTSLRWLVPRNKIFLEAVQRQNRRAVKS